MTLLNLAANVYAKNSGPRYEVVNPNRGVKGVDFVIVPNVVGKNIHDPEMKKKLAESGFTVGMISWGKNKKIPAGIITSQGPEAGMAIKKPVMILVDVSDGP